MCVYLILCWSYTQVSEDAVSTSDGRWSLFKQLIGESDQAYQLVSLSILLSSWPQLIVDSDRYLWCHSVLLRHSEELLSRLINIGGLTNFYGIKFL